MSRMSSRSSTRSLACSLLLLGPAWLVAGPAAEAASPTSRFERPVAWVLPAGPAREAALLEGVSVRATGMRALPSGIVLALRSRPTLGPVEIVEVRGSLRGVPLLRPVAKVAIASDGRVVGVTWLDPVPALVPGSARLTASEAIAVLEASGLAGSRGGTEATLVVDPQPGGSVLAWRIDPPLDRATLRNPVFLVDARSGAIRPLFDRVRAAQVRAFSANPVATPSSGIYDLVNIDDGAINLHGPYWQARNCIAADPGAMCAPQALATADMAGDFLGPTPDVDDPLAHDQLEDEYAEVSVYYHADKFDAWLESLGFAGIPCRMQGEVATIIANYRGPGDAAGTPGWFPNAFYTGDCGFTIALGQGQGVDFGWDGDVIYHEIGHGVVDTQMGDDHLGAPYRRSEGVVNDAGALNEGTADFLSSSFTGDPMMGDYVETYGGSGRNNANDFLCPGDLVGEIHYDGEPWTAALYEAYAELGEAFVPVVIDSIAMFAPDASFEDAAAAVVAMSDASLGPAQAMIVEEALAGRNLLDCVRVAPWAAVRRELWLVPPDGDEKYKPMRPPAYQVLFEVPENATMMHLTFDVETFAKVPTYDVNLIVKHGSPIEFTYQYLGMSYEVTADSDDFHGDITAGVLDLEVEGGEQIYGAFFNLGLDLASISNLQVEFELEPESGTSTGESGLDDTGGSTSEGTSEGVPEESSEGSSSGGSAGQQAVDDGCSCRQGAASGAAAWWGLMVVAAGRRRLVGLRARRCAR
jgi:hypothetical protein